MYATYIKSGTLLCMVLVRRWPASPPPHPHHRCFCLRQSAPHSSFCVSFLRWRAQTDTREHRKFQSDHCRLKSLSEADRVSADIDMCLTLVCNIVTYLQLKLRCFCRWRSFNIVLPSHIPVPALITVVRCRNE